MSHTLFDHPLMNRPRSRAQARRRKAVTLTVVAFAVAIGAPFLVAAARGADRDICYIIPERDGTWYGVNFNSQAGIPEGCELRVWQDPNL